MPPTPGPPSRFEHDWRALAELWRRAAETSPCDVAATDRLLLGGLAALVGAGPSALAFARRDPTQPGLGIDGWTLVEGVSLGRSPAERLRVAELTRRHAYTELSDVRALVAGAGRVRWQLQSSPDPAPPPNPAGPPPADVANIARDPRLSALLEALEVGSRICVAVPLAPDCEAYAMLDRRPREPRFRPREAELAAQAMAGLTTHLRGAALGRGVLPLGRILTPREREALDHLGTGRSEKEIATELGLTVRSAHQIVVAIYRKLGVQSRPELMALLAASERARR